MRRIWDDNHKITKSFYSFPQYPKPKSDEYSSNALFTAYEWPYAKGIQT